ncbi:MAG: NAD(P)-binding domain-containing protein [Patescibacteria group bacterium]|nr:NAD(P)-binding domain-containing protein [Patescibacteria group bacterium]
MKIGILGTGMVGRAHAQKLVELGHDVMIGTGDVDKTLNKISENDFNSWYKNIDGLKIGAFTEAAVHGELIINAIKGEMALAVLSLLYDGLNNKIIIDISNPLEFDEKRSVKLFVCNTDSLGEQIQKALPDSLVVKTLNTVNANLQVNPSLLSDGNHDVFVSGNNEKAKQLVAKFLKEFYGWKNIIDLGDITTARGTEALMIMWLNLSTKFGTAMFNYKILK